MTTPNVVQKHPAASTAVVAGTPATILIALGLPNPWATIVSALTAYAPMATLWVINHGGLAGVWKMLFHGKP